MTVPPVPAQRPGAPAAPLLVVQHASFAGPGLAEAVWRRAGLRLDVVPAWEAPVPTDPGDAAGVVVLGGPQAAFADEVPFPTRDAETTLLAAAVDAGLPVLGICLGAQLLAAATGGGAYRGAARESGWTELDLSPAAADDPVLGALPRGSRVMQSHRDGITAPPGAVVLARTPRYPVQAFRVGPRAWGLQFHLEAEQGFAATRRSFVADWDGAGAGDVALGAADEARAVAALLPAATAAFARFGLLVRARAGLPPLRAGRPPALVRGAR